MDNIEHKMWGLYSMSQNEKSNKDFRENSDGLEESKEDLPLTDVTVKDDVKNEPMEQEHSSNSFRPLKSDEAIEKSTTTKAEKQPQPYEQISIKGYNSNFVKEDPVNDISIMYKEGFVDFEKQKYHQEIFDKIIEDLNHIKIADLENRYIDHIRQAAKLEVFNCLSCEYQTIQKSNIRLHLVIIHKTDMETKMLKCLKCSYTCKSPKYMDRHILSHNKDEESDFEDDDNNYFSDDFCSDNSVDFVLKKTARNTRYKKNENKRIENRLRNNLKPRTIYKCLKCEFESHKKIELKKHINSNHQKDIKMWSCDLCSFETGDKEYFLTHKQTHKSPDNMKKFICYKCNYESLDKVKLKKHLLKLHKIITKGMDSIKILKCDFCDYETDLIRSLQVHSLSHKSPDEIQWFQCDVCEFKTKFKKSYTEHLIRHKNPEEIEKSFMCEFCSYKCRTKGSLKKHLLTHQPPDENTEWFKCPHCDHKTKSKSHLRVHLTVHKDPSEIKMYVCDICGLQSRRKWNYEMHLLTHKNSAEVEIFKCTVCNYKTKFKDRLKRHLKKGHHGGRGREGKLQRCSICNFECRNRKIYCRHVMSHKTEINQVEGAYVCDVCGFKTMYNSSFSKHKKTHKTMDEVQTFKCPHCDYRTKFKGNLKHHINTHKDPSEITMYKCETCGIQFRRKENLNVHLLLHKSPDEVEMIKCSLCSYQTKFRAYMTTHLKKTHKIVTRKNEYKAYTTTINPQANVAV